MAELDITFDAMGSHVRFLIGEPAPGMPPAAEAAERERRFVHEFDAALSRFKPESELCALNADPRRRVPASELLRRAVAAGLAAAERTEGLVDPTLVREIEAAGYVGSRAGVQGAPLPRPWPRRRRGEPPRPGPAQRWRDVRSRRGGRRDRPPARERASTPGEPARAWRRT